MRWILNRNSIKFQCYQHRRCSLIKRGVLLWMLAISNPSSNRQLFRFPRPSLQSYPSWLVLSSPIRLVHQISPTKPPHRLSNTSNISNISLRLPNSSVCCVSARKNTVPDTKRLLRNWCEPYPNCIQTSGTDQVCWAACVWTVLAQIRPCIYNRVFFQNVSASVSIRESST